MKSKDAKEIELLRLYLPSCRGTVPMAMGEYTSNPSERLHRTTTALGRDCTATDEPVVAGCPTAESIGFNVVSETSTTAASVASEEEGDALNNCFFVVVGYCSCWRADSGLGMTCSEIT